MVPLGSAKCLNRSHERVVQVLDVCILSLPDSIFGLSTLQDTTAHRRYQIGEASDKCSGFWSGDIDYQDGWPHDSLASRSGIEKLEG